MACVAIMQIASATLAEKMFLTGTPPKRCRRWQREPNWYGQLSHVVNRPEITNLDVQL